MSSIEGSVPVRILRGTAAALEVTLHVDGAPTDADGDVTVTVTRGDGSTVVSAQTATKVATGVYRYALTPTQVAQVDRLTTTWTASLGGVAGQTFSQTYEVVGAHLFTEAEARTFDVTAGGSPAMENQAKYPDVAIREARDRIAEQFEEICGVAFGTRYGVDVLDGDGASELLLDGHRVTKEQAVATREDSSWTVFTQAQLDDLLLLGGFRLVRETLGAWPSGQRNVRVEYEHGWEQPPAPIRRAALTVLRNELVPSAIPDRALSQSGEFGTFRLATANPERGFWYGIPRVDAALSQYRERVPVVA